LSSSPGDASSHQQSDPPILSQRHLSLSPPKASTSTIQDKNKHKETRQKLTTCNPDTPMSKDPSAVILAALQNLKRKNKEQVCQFSMEQQQQINHLAAELTKSTESKKRHLDEISSLTKDVESKNKKLRMTKTQNETLKNKIDTLKKERNKIRERFHVMKEKAKEQHDELSALQQSQEAIKRKAYNSGFGDATAHAASTHTIALPNVLDKTTVSTLIVDSFKKVHPAKPPMHCAMVVADAVWTLFDGQCKDYLTDWSTEIIRQKNPYRQGEEIAKVMDLSAGQLNISGYKELRKGLEKKNKQGLIPRAKGWLCSQYYVQEAMYSIEKVAKREIPYQMLPGIDGFQFDYEKALLYLNDKVFKLSAPAKDRTQPRILWGFTCDGVRVSRNVSLMIAGVKCLDPRAIDPRTGEYVSLVQSPDCCFPFKVIVCSDCWR
jgi:hypothetical protein